MFCSVEGQTALADMAIRTYDNNGQPDKKLNLKEFSAFIKDEVRALDAQCDATSFSDVIRIFEGLIVAIKAIDTDDDEFDPDTDDEEELLTSNTTSRI